MSIDPGFHVNVTTWAGVSGCSGLLICHCPGAWSTRAHRRRSAQRVADSRAIPLSAASDRAKDFSSCIEDSCTLNVSLGSVESGNGGSSFSDCGSAG